MEPLNERYWVGFDLGGTKMLITLFDEQLHKVQQMKLKTMPHDGVRASIDRVIASITDAIAAWKLPLQAVAGIGLAVPGVLDMSAGVVLHAPNLGWRDVELKKMIEQAVKIPVVIVNDVDAGTFGEYRLGGVTGERCVLGVFSGTGIGGSCVYEGRILQGSCTTAMEIGHIQVVEEGMRCGCGKYGCLETVAGRLAIAGQAAIAAYRGEAPALLASAGCDLKKIKSGTLAKAIDEGDAVIEDIVRRAARWLGKGIASAMNLLAPDAVLLGGGLVKAMPSIFIEEVVAGIDPVLFRMYRKRYRLAIAQLGDDAVCVGAAACAEESAKRK
jgi:glucokinase